MDCSPPLGFVTLSTDCDDADAEVNPDAEEVCDGIDNDCSGEIDDDPIDIITWYIDADEDGYGSDSISIDSCDAISGFVAVGDDCDDSDAGVNPSATEDCDGIDNDCDDEIDESGSTVWYQDLDSDGYGDPDISEASCDGPSGYVSTGDDCNDDDASINPGEDEICDEIDNDCDDEIDEDAIDALIFYPDSDSDGYGGSSDEIEQCVAPPGYVASSSDCNDADADVHPGADELCNGVDDDCDDEVDEEGTDGDTYYADTDSDGYGDPDSTTVGCSTPSGYVDNSTDCDDSDASISPEAIEVCDEVDNDCDADIDEDVKTVFYADTDEDGHGDEGSTTEACAAPTGYVAVSTDCDDSDASVSPDATEVCNSVDDDCNDIVDDDPSDGDSY